MSKRFVMASSLALLLALGATQAGHAEDLAVPDDYDTIQEAIDEAVDGDTVRVAAGTYVENIDFLGKAITVVGTDGAEETTIDGSDATGDLQSCVVFFDEEGPDSVLEGFTLTGGGGSDIFVTSAETSLIVGGGICGDGAAPTIRDCIVELGVTEGDGAGMFFQDLPVDATLVLEDCTIRDNECTVVGAGGIHISSGAAEITDCTIRDNDGGFIGGGISVRACDLIMTNCRVSGNDGGLLGGGIMLFTGSTGILTDLTVVSNKAGFGAGVMLEGADATLERCLIAGNDSSDGRGGGMNILTDGTVDIINCTFADNLGLAGGAISVASLSTGEINLRNCILWNNEGGDASVTDSTTFTYCLYDEGSEGTGNLDVDPEFRDPEGGDYRLTGDSPAIDGGDPDDPEDPDETPIDMGAFFYDQNAVYFKRGDVDNNGTVSALSDGLFLLKFQFQEGDAPECDDAADVNDNGTVSALSDAIFLFRWMFLEDTAPPDPGPTSCGADPDGDDDDLFCDTPSDECA